MFYLLMEKKYFKKIKYFKFKTKYVRWYGGDFFVEIVIFINYFLKKLVSIKNLLKIFHI